MVLSTELTPELLREGIARDLVRLVQDRRKSLGCEYTDRIEIAIVSDSADVGLAVQENSAYIQGETLAVSITAQPLAESEPIEHDLGEARLTLFVRVVA